MKTSFNGAIQELLKLREPWVIFAVGVPGCGKSTFIRRLQAELTLTARPRGDLLEAHVLGDYPLVIASSDDLIEERAKQLGVTYSEAFDRFIKICSKEFKFIIENALRSKQNLIIDRTQVGRKARREHLEKVPAGYTKVAITFDVSDVVLRKRLDDRSIKTGKTIPDFVSASMLQRYETPSRDEGFDLLITVENDRDL